MKTKWGIAKKNKDGHYMIYSRNNNFGRLLHRLIFEEFYQIKLSPDIVIHHDDGDKTNNEIWNLIPMTKGEHSKYHNQFLSHTKETKDKISKNLSLSKTTSGYYRVIQCRNERYKQGYYWKYQYIVNGKQKAICGGTLEKLKEKVLAKGLEWVIIDEEKAKECELYE